MARVYARPDVCADAIHFRYLRTRPQTVHLMVNTGQTTVFDA